MSVAIETQRMRLRGWRDEDGDAFVAATNTAEVMEHLGGVEDPAVLKAAVARQQALLAANGYCFWIIERVDDGAVLGFCGLKPGEVGPIADEVEIGWRLRADAWGQGYAREAAEATLDWAWANLDAPRVVAITVLGNVRSWGLMKRLGMRRRKDLDFAHPRFPPDHPLSWHICYAMDRP
ncbi:GNAT family N-acetyltransferase [Sphingomonas flavalba]|uniref:GNAT family N-acetyltransferase n=1 Tax=Sphingomonas flavalba TaxID=2559804 RepID=UPI0039DF6685